MLLISQMLSGIVAGGMIFFAFFMAPLVFTQLEPKEAGKFIRAVFPWYYLAFGSLFITLAILLFLSSQIIPGFVSLICSIGFLIARQYLMPLINKYSDSSLQGDSSAGVMFERLHRISVAINMIQLIAILGIFYMLAI